MAENGLNGVPAGWTLLGTEQDGSPDMTSYLFTTTASAGMAGSQVSVSLQERSKTSLILLAGINERIESSGSGGGQINAMAGETSPLAPGLWNGLTATSGTSSSKAISWAVVISPQ